MTDSSPYSSLAALASSHLTKCNDQLANDNVPMKRFIIPQLNSGKGPPPVSTTLANQIAHKLKAAQPKPQEETPERNTEENESPSEDTKLINIFKSIKLCSNKETDSMKDFEEFDIEIIDSGFEKPIIKKEPLLPCAVNKTCNIKVSKYKKAKCSKLGKTICALYYHKIVPYRIEKRSTRISPFRFETQSPDDFVLRTLNAKKAFSDSIIVKV